MKRLDYIVTILRAIAAPKMRRSDIAVLYTMLLRTTSDPRIPTVNAAIIERWSSSGLQAIKRMAWRDVERRSSQLPGKR